MRQDTSVSESTDPAGAGVSIRRIVLKVDHFDLVTNMLGHSSPDAKADFIGITYRQLRRARKGEVVGEKFVAGTLDALKSHRETFADAGIPITFESLFETTGGRR